MIRIIIIIAILLYVFSQRTHAQIIIAEQDFDAETTWSYSSNINFFSQVDNSGINIYPDDSGWGNDGFYGVIDQMTASPLNYGNLNTNILGAFDLDDEDGMGTSGDAVISFQSINIVNYNDVTISFDYDVDGFNALGDEFTYEVFEDSVGQGVVVLAEGTSAEGSEEILVSNNATAAYIEIINDFNGEDNYSGFDNVTIEGVRAPSTPIVFFNEVHYDNSSTDINEFIEIAIEDSFTGKLDNIQITLYNGNNGSVYDQFTLDNFTEGTTFQGFTFYTWYPSSIQNGGPDGFALNYNDTLVEFLSYEGTFTATEGPANGQLSTDIGVEESNTTPTGESLQRTGSCSGDCPNGLSWTGPATASPGSQNTLEVLPVDWRSFTAHKLHNNGAQLNWATANEFNNDHFVVEHSTDAGDWQDIGIVQAARKKQSIYKYQFVDKYPAKGVNYYRLRQVDIDGVTNHSKIQKVQLDKNSNRTVVLYPNPVHSVLNIQGFLSLEKPLQFQILDISGRTVMNISKPVPKIPVAHLYDGLYSLSISNEIETKYLRFIKK